MCLILFSYRQRDDYPLVFAANRDEFYDRPSAALDFWQERPEILAGKDLKASGTWLGVSRHGRLAAITNYRDPSVQLNGAPSRGLLVSEFISGEIPAATYLESLSQNGIYYNGFNLLVGDGTGLWYYSNRGRDPIKLSPGLYGLSNHLLNTPWPKVKKGKTALRRCLEGRGRIDVPAIFDLLSDRSLAADHDLPDTGVGRQWERALSAVFITSAPYGTRSSSVLLMDAAGTLNFWERTYRIDPGSRITSDTRRHRIQLPPGTLP